MWDLSFPDQGSNLRPCIGSMSLNHWTAREAPKFTDFITYPPLECRIYERNYLSLYLCITSA